MVDAAALYDTTLSVTGLHARRFAALDLAEPYAASARILAHLNSDPEIDRFRAGLLRSAEELGRVTPEEAYLFQTGNRDHFSEQRLEELDFATHDRFEWLIKKEDHRQDWAETLFQKVADQLGLDALFENMPAPEKTTSDRDALGDWISRKETWMRDTVAALPDYASRREDRAELVAMMMQSDFGYSPKRNLENDTVLFDLLAEKGLRRTGSDRLKMMDTNGDISHIGDSIFYEHHAAFKDVDWVWLIKTTGATQLYYQSAKEPFLDDAIRRKPQDYNATAFAREQQALADARNRKHAKGRESVARRKYTPKTPEVAQVNAPSKSVMEAIRGLLRRT